MHLYGRMVSCCTRHGSTRLDRCLDDARGKRNAKGKEMLNQMEFTRASISFNTFQFKIKMCRITFMGACDAAKFKGFRDRHGTQWPVVVVVTRHGYCPTPDTQPVDGNKQMATAANYKSIRFEHKKPISSENRLRSRLSFHSSCCGCCWSRYQNLTSCLVSF